MYETKTNKDFKKILAVIETGTTRLSNQVKKSILKNLSLWLFFAWRVTFINHADLVLNDHDWNIFSPSQV